MTDGTFPSGSEPGLSRELRQRIDATVANWKRKLLDLSRRNRALNFKPTKVSTVTIVDEQPAEVFRRLYLDEATMKFRPSQSTSDPEGEREQSLKFDLSANDETLEFESESTEAPEFVPYDPSSIDERHSDSWLQTRLAPQDLDHSLRRIDEQTRSAIEEQGVNTLFLTLGAVQYRESPYSEVWFRAPLVLLPVELTRKSAAPGTPSRLPMRMP